ncbi:MAG: NAD(P)/FAD-dependent oxidoreductase [Planctomycetaceae bacterium]
MKKWSVIGGGMLGMRTAQLLAREGADVTLYEADDHLGGLADAWKLGDVTWDRHYHVTLLSDFELREVLQELGLEDDIRWVETKTGFFTDGNLYSMSNTVEFLKFPPLSMIDKLRLGGTIFLGSKIKNWQKLETILVEDWLRKWSGSRTTNKMWLPLLRAKLGENYKKTSAAFIWATIARMYAARRSGLKKEMFGYVSGGYQKVLDKYETQLLNDGVTVKTGHALKNAESIDDGIELTFANGTVESCDNVVMTIPSPLISRMVPQLEMDEHEKLNSIQYQGIVCASLVLKESLSPYYVTNITDDWVPFTAVIEMSALVDKSEFGGNALVYLPRYADPDDAIFERTDDDLREEFVSALEKMYPHFNRDQVEAFKVSRVRHVVGLSTLNYSKNLPSMETSVPGIYAVNSAQIVNGTLNVHETLALAKRAFNDLLKPRMHVVQEDVVHSKEPQPA